MNKLLVAIVIMASQTWTWGATIDVTAPPYSCASNGSVDVTTSVQAAIDGAAKGDVILFRPGTYLISGIPGLKLHGGLTYDLRGATLTQGINKGGSGLYGRNRLLETVVGARDITILGGVVKGSREYVGGMQWSVGLRIDSATSVLVEGTAFEDWFTDGIYIGGNPPGSVDITLRGVRISNSKRNGMSIVCGRGIRIERSIFETANCNDGKPIACSAYDQNMPMSGIDFEPNVVTDVIDDVRVTDSMFRYNQKSGIFTQGKGKGARYVFDGNRFIGNGDIGLIVNQVSDVIISNNYVDGARIGISVGAGVRNVTMVDNEIMNTTGNGINVAGVYDPFFARNKVNGEKVAYLAIPLMDAVSGSVHILPFE